MEDQVDVTFEVFAEVNIGETVCISGDLPILGSFQQYKELFTTPSTYPIWTLTLKLPKGTHITYRYLTTGFHRFIDWEPVTPSLRSLEITSSLNKTQFVHDDFGVHPSCLSVEVEVEKVSTSLPPLVPSNPLVLIAFHLPIKLRWCPGEIWEIEWDQDNPAAKSDGDSIANEMQVTWIGGFTPLIVCNLPTEEDFFSPSPERKSAIELACRKLNCIPLFFTEQVYRLHYVQFSKHVMWDVFHNVLVPKEIDDDDLNSFDLGYVKGNEALAELAMQHLTTGNEIVWVHDYHLLLLPKVLVERGHRGPIIFFLHIPFPTSEIFRVLPMKRRLLEGMLSSSVIGFHTFNHGRHFLTSCRRFLGAHSRSYGTSGALAVEYRDRRVLITISHLGVDSDRIRRCAMQAETKVRTQRILGELQASGTRTLLPAKIVFGSLDELQRLKGVCLKLLAFERFLELYPKWALGQARFVLWTVMGGERKHDSMVSQKEVRELVNRINVRFGQVVMLREFDLTCSPPLFEDRIAFWLAIDIMVSTAVCEGLNVSPLEFTLCKRDRPGVVILSEFSASAFVMNGAVRVNCYDIAFIAICMDECARMSSKEKQARFARDADLITLMTISKWAKFVISEVVNVLEDSKFFTIDPDITTLSPLRRHLFHHAPVLDVKQVVAASAHSKRRVFLFDFGGTLVPREEHSLFEKKDFLPPSALPDETKTLLLALCCDANNLVFIISGGTRTLLARTFDGLPAVGLVAHSGLCVRFPRHQVECDVQTMAIQDRYRSLTMLDEQVLPEEEEGLLVPACDIGPDWQLMVDVAEFWCEWMERSGILDVVKRFTWTTVGSFYSHSTITTLWDYSRTDAEFGLAQAQLLLNELEALISKHNLNVTVKHSKETLQLLPSGVDKGFSLRKIFSALPVLKPEWNGLTPDFCLALGDDTTDEMMFGTCHQYFTASTRVFTATVGRKLTTASFYVTDTESTLSLLKQVVDGNVV